jgi:hypothetical protein
MVSAEGHKDADLSRDEAAGDEKHEERPGQESEAVPHTLVRLD